MPLYYFKCATCDKTETISLSINDTIQTPECPTCKTPMERSFGLQTIIFRGNGWGKDA